jgi:hypothetical protein
MKGHDKGQDQYKTKPTLTTTSYHPHIPTIIKNDNKTKKLSRETRKGHDDDKGKMTTECRVMTR